MDMATESRQLEQILDPGSLSWALLNQVGCAVILIDESMSLVYANPIAERAPVRRRFCADGSYDAHATDGGSLRLRNALQGALAGRATVVELFDGGHCLLVAVSPVTLERNRRGALITCERTQLLSCSSFRIYARALGLTGREIEVVDQLASGCEPKAAAVALQMSIETMRSHIKAVLAKSASNSIREFLLRLAKLPPVLEAADADCLYGR